MLFALTALSSWLFAQEISLKDALGGAKWKSEIPASEIPSGWNAVRIKVQGFQSFYDTLMPFLLLSGGGNASEEPIMQLLRLSEISWTDGEWKTIDGESYLITYQMHVELPDLMKSRNKADLTPPNLQLRLIRKSSITSLEPLAGVTKDDYTKVLLPDTALSSPSQIAAKRAATLSNMKQISLGLIMYASDYDDVLPYAQGTEAVKYVTYPYIKNVQIWKTYNPNGGDIRFNMCLAGADFADIERPAETVMFYESKQWPDGTRCVAFTDGHVKMLDPNVWMNAASTLSLKLKKKAKPLPLNYGIGKVPDPAGSGGAPPP